MSVKKLLVAVVALVLLAVGVSLLAFFFMGLGAGGTATNSSDPEGFNVPEVENTREEQADEGLEDKTLAVTIPKMSRVDNAAVPDTEGDDEDALGSNPRVGHGPHRRGR